MRTIPFRCAVAFTVAPLAVQAQTRVFLVKLGTDTFAVERVVRTGAKVEGTIARHLPFASLFKYSLTLNADGTVVSYEQGSYRADGTSASPNPQTGASQVGLRMTFTGDTVVREVPTNGQVVVRRSAVPKGTLPAIAGGSWYFYEIQVAAARRDGKVNVIGFGATQAAPTSPDIRLVGADSAEAVVQGFRTGLKLDRNGQLVHGDGSLTTQKFDARVARDGDLAALATAWAAKETGPAAPLSTRDTARADMGAAKVMLDYGRPSKRGREIWGKLVPLDTVWRFGANSAATLTTDRDLDIGGSAVPAGTYTVWLLPYKGGAHLIVNKKVKDDKGVALWGTMYDPSQDLAHIPLEPRTFKESAERYTVTLSGTELVIQWDRSGYAVKVRAK